MTSIVTWAIPTLLIVNSFSLFTYYVAKLNIEIENSKEGHNNDSMNAAMIAPISDYLIQSTAQNNSLKYKRFRISLLKPFFIFFNILALISFFIIPLSCKSMHSVITL